MELPVTIDGDRITAYFTKRTFVFEDSEIFNNTLSSYGFLYMYKLVNVDINWLNIENNVANQGTLD